jgi:DNA polymerase-3 subunit epsilon
MLIPEEARLINGITDAMVKDQNIDWDKVIKALSLSQLCVAHNASFDRAFLDRYLEDSKIKVWACSINDINWIERGFTNSKLELLSYWHGFYYDSHRAMNDVDAMIHLLTHPHYKTNKPIVELISNARKFKSRMIVQFKYNKDLVDLIKSKRYYFNGETKEWSKIITEDEQENEKEWLAENIYKGTFSGLFEQLNLIDKYKDR